MNIETAFDQCQKFIERFGAAAENSKQAFAQATPFPHAVFDNLFEPSLIQALLQEFPSPDSAIWERTNDHDVQVKLRSSWKTDKDIAPITREVVRTLNSGAFLRHLSVLTEIPHLISDPYYTGGGLNCILPGGHLDLHCDGNWHHAMAVHRRLNAILYLNPDWDESWGGALEFWDSQLNACQKKIFPHNNRFVVFETHDLTYHGHPEPLACPQGRSRNSLILYFYTSSPRPAQQITVAEPHSALWRKRNQLKVE